VCSFEWERGSKRKIISIKENYLQKGKLFPKRKIISKKENYFQKGKSFPKMKIISKKENYFHLCSNMED